MTSPRKKKLWSLMIDDEIRDWIFSLGKMGDSANGVMHRLKDLFESKGYALPAQSAKTEKEEA